MGETGRIVGEPQEGYFRMRLVKGGPWVGARIHRAMDGSMVATVNGFPGDPDHVWTYGRTTTQDDYERLLLEAEYARATDPGSPRANPTSKVDLRSTRTPF